MRSGKEVAAAWRDFSASIARTLDTRRASGEAQSGLNRSCDVRAVVTISTAPIRPNQFLTQDRPFAKATKSDRSDGVGLWQRLGVFSKARILHAGNRPIVDLIRAIGDPEGADHAIELGQRRIA